MADQFRWLFRLKVCRYVGIHYVILHLKKMIHIFITQHFKDFDSNFLFIILTRPTKGKLMTTFSTRKYHTFTFINLVQCPQSSDVQFHFLHCIYPRRWLRLIKYSVQESKQSGILGILQVKELLMSIITQIYRFVQPTQRLSLSHNVYISQCS